MMPSIAGIGEWHCPEFSPLIPSDKKETADNLTLTTGTSHSITSGVEHSMMAWSQTLATPPTDLMSLAPIPLPELVEPIATATVSPATGSQLYAQRRAALHAGTTYTRVSPDSFYDQWFSATTQPTYQDWVNLLTQEANAVGSGQGSNQLTVLLGDSLSLWFPVDQLPSDRLWLNQGISGDTSTGVLNRISVLKAVQPTTIHLMVGINDLRHGVSDDVLVGNIQSIVQQLQQDHPDAKIVVHSILPTRLPAIPTSHITALNQRIEAIAEQQGVYYLNLQDSFLDTAGILNRDFTTDGIHLSDRGYAVWQSALRLFNLA
jgi:lysophospholipase L1-like esterase